MSEQELGNCRTGRQTEVCVKSALADNKVKWTQDQQNVAGLEQQLCFGERDQSAAIYDHKVKHCASGSFQSLMLDCVEILLQQSAYDG